MMDWLDDEQALALRYYANAHDLLTQRAPATKDKPEAVAVQSTKPSAQQPQDAAIQVPRLKVKDLTWQNRATFNAMMEKHSFVVLTDIGDKIESHLAQLMDSFDAFFSSSDDAWKTGCTSKQVYRNENGTPMWYCGYEHTSVRDCYRVHCGDMSRLVWPNDAFERHWITVLRSLQRICDQALRLTMGYKTAPFDKRTDVDYSVCYGLHYPNIAGSGQSENENVFEHVDPSLYVAEPVPSVEGLDVFDQHSKQWIKAEHVCTPGKEIVLFCGKALQRCTQGRIPGTLHRVRRTDEKRFCIIYEQKYEEYFL